MIKPLIKPQCHFNIHLSFIFDNSLVQCWRFPFKVVPDEWLLTSIGIEINKNKLEAKKKEIGICEFDYGWHAIRGVYLTQLLVEQGHGGGVV